MQLNEIYELWDVDSHFERDLLTEETLKIPRLHSKYLRILSEERIRLKTYIEKTEGVKSNRIVEIYNLNSNKLLVNSITTWCLVNAKTNKPNRITAEIRQAFGK